MTGENISTEATTAHTRRVAQMARNFKGGPPTTRLSAEELVARGYRRTSNAYGRISRIDRPDWLEVLAEKMRRAPADFILRDGTGQVSPLWCDFYRRVYSQDAHTVSPSTLALIPGSDHDPIGYVEYGCERNKAS
jgi:hypothetical protein